MIGNTITTTLATAVLMTSITQTVTGKSNYQYLTNREEQTTYLSNNIDVDTRTVYQIQTYNGVRFGSAANMKIRGIQKYQKIYDTNDNDYHYEYDSYLILKTEAPNLTYDLYTSYDMNLQMPYDIPPLEDEYTSYDYVNMITSYTNTQNNDINYFLNGHNYNNYESIEAIYNTIDGIPKEQITQGLGNPPYQQYYLNEQINYTYYIIRFHFIYIQSTQDNGAQFENFTPRFNNFDFEITITANEIPAGYEPIDLPGLMFEILGMPFAWLSTAFNLTLFPGTMYAINIADIIMAILGALILIVIVKKVIK